jgi:hypothetical protein
MPEEQKVSGVFAQPQQRRNVVTLATVSMVRLITN